ncbi:MAG: hypothetical protein ABIP95_08815, partial [Pelobium sp.]
MKTLFVCAVIGTILSGCNAQQNNLKDYDNLLSNGTSNFHTYGKNMVGTAWTVDDGVLHLNPDVADQAQRGDLTTNED